MKRLTYSLTLCLLLYSFILSGQSVDEGPLVAGRHFNEDTAPVARQSMMSCVPLFSFDTPDPNETGIAGDGDFLWVGGGMGTGFFKCDASGAIVQTLPMPASPNLFYLGDLDYDGTSLWYTYEQSGTLFQIDPANGNVINTFLLPNNSINITDPNIWGIACDDSCLWEMEYAVPNTPYPMASYLYKLSFSAVPLDSFLIPHWILPIKMINGDLWGVSFDTPYIYKIDRTTGAMTDSIPKCAGPGYGLAQNNSGFWVVGEIPGLPDRIHLFETLTGVEHTDGKTPWFSMYPQPATDQLFIQFNSEHSIAKIEVFDLPGKRISNSELNSENSIFTLPLDDLLPGMYAVRITSGSKVGVDSFIKL